MLPFELSYKDLGVTFSDDDVITGKRRSPSQAGDRKARMYYATAREYAKLQGLTIRGPAVLLDSHRANMGMLYAARGGKAMEYARALFDKGWPSGWRDIDMTDVDVLEHTLIDSGCNSKGFRDYLTSGEAALEYEKVRIDAKSSGITGVPHYALQLDGALKPGLFGREHLSLLRHWLHEAGLQRRDDVIPDVSHAWRGA